MNDPSNTERQLIELFTLAGEYCINVENADQTSKEALLTFFSRISPILYVRGLLFPETPEPEEEGNERFVTEEQWEDVFNSLRNIFGADDEFSFVDEESLQRNDMKRGSLAEMLADVYQDMKDFAWLMSKGTTLARDFAAYNIRNYFLSNWGYKLLQVQIILHQRLLSRPLSEEEYDFE